jgi:hypothetical protein
MRPQLRSGTRAHFVAPTLRAWMMRLIYLFQPFFDYMGIDLRRRDVGMAEHQLDRPQIRATLQQVRGKTVSQHMRG